MAHEPAVVVFDGTCVLCSRWVDFLLRHDREERFRLAAMQGRHGRELLAAHGLSPDDPASLLLVVDGTGYVDTAAIAGVLQRLGRRWRIAAALIRALPSWIGNPAYRWVARHRYRLFGRRNQCRLPEADQAWRFLD